MERLDRTVPRPAPVFVALVCPKMVPVNVPLVTMATPVRDPATVVLIAARNACVETRAFVIVKQDNATVLLVGQVYCVSCLALQSQLFQDALEQTAQKGRVSLNAVEYVCFVFRHAILFSWASGA